ncbi:hypothetical protein LCGC14_2744480 [marine sediment metagenome]|uniref:Uncharacterized protein n=1 Tax=marine sediment metagenome TaxID=412755 RepID=A0A0F9BCE0_9ZZZZ
MAEEPANITLAAEVVDGAEQTFTQAKKGLDVALERLKNDPIEKLQVIEELVHGAAETVKTGLHSIGQSLFRFPSNVVSNVNYGIQKITGSARDVVDDALAGVDEGFGALTGGINEVAGGINENLSAVGRGVTNIPTPPPPPSPPKMPSPPKVGS